MTNRLRERYEQEERFFLALDPSNAQDREEIESFAREHFPGSLETRVGDVEIVADIEATLVDLDAYVLIKYHDGEGEHAVYFKDTAAQDPALQKILRERGPGHVHVYVGGNDLAQALERLRAHLGIQEEQAAQAEVDDHTRTYVVKNKLGIHARPSTLFVKEAGKYESKVTVTDTRTGKEVDGKSIIGVLTMGATQGTKIMVTATGPDYRQALDGIGGLIKAGFNE